MTNLTELRRLHAQALDTRKAWWSEQQFVSALYIGLPELLDRLEAAEAERDKLAGMPALLSAAEVRLDAMKIEQIVLQGRIVSLEAELEYAQSTRHDEQLVHAALVAARASLVTVEKERDNLDRFNALLSVAYAYADHLPSCPVTFEVHGECDCGYREAAAAVEGFDL